MTARRRTEGVPPGIGTLNERPLHAALKDWCAEPGDRFEVPIDGFVADIVRGVEVIEIQTGSVGALRRKLTALLSRRPVRLTVPIPLRTMVVRVDPAGNEISRRASPRRGRLVDLFSELVGIPDLLGDANLSIDALFVEQEEIRRPARRRRRAWTIEERRLIRVVDQISFRTPSDYLAVIPPEIGSPFTTGDLASALSIPRRTAQKIAFCLRRLGVLQAVGKRGNSWLYVRSMNGPGREARNTPVGYDRSDR